MHHSQQNIELKNNIESRLKDTKEWTLVENEDQKDGQRLRPNSVSFLRLATNSPLFESLLSTVSSASVPALSFTPPAVQNLSFLFLTAHLSQNSSLLPHQSSTPFPAFPFFFRLSISLAHSLDFPSLVWFSFFLVSARRFPLLFFFHSFFRNSLLKSSPLAAAPSFCLYIRPLNPKTSSPFPVFATSGAVPGFLASCYKCSLPRLSFPFFFFFFFKTTW